MRAMLNLQSKNDASAVVSGILATAEEMATASRSAVNGARAAHCRITARRLHGAAMRVIEQATAEDLEVEELRLQAARVDQLLAVESPE